MEASEDDDEFEEDYKDGSSLHDALLRKIWMLCQRFVENERLIKCLKMEFRLSKSHGRQTKHQISIVSTFATSSYTHVHELVAKVLTIKVKIEGLSSALVIAFTMWFCSLP